MINKTDKKAALAMAAVLALTGLSGHAVEGTEAPSTEASGETVSEAGILESIMKGLSAFVYKVYEWPENLTVGGLSFKIAESLYTIREDGLSVLWNDQTAVEEMEDFYSSTDWNRFEGMYETIELSNTCEAALTDEVAAYEDLMDQAAEDYGFSIYKEIFKAMAQARYNEYQDVYAEAKANGKINGTGDDEFDLFHIDGSWIDGGDTPVGEAKAPDPAINTKITSVTSSAETGSAIPGLEETESETMAASAAESQYEELLSRGDYTVGESITLAAQAFSEILYDAVFPSPYDTDDLTGVVQCFEFGGNSDAITQQYLNSGYSLSGYEGFVSFSSYFDNAVYSGSQSQTLNEEKDYDAIIEDYAKVIADGKVRTAQDEYGKYKYSDQKFYQKVFECYKCSGGGTVDYGNLPDDMKEILRQCMATWDSRVTEERREIIQQAVLLYGVTYSMDARNTPSVDNPQYLDCSSFTGQCYWRAGILDKSAAYWTTGSFASNFIQISESQLIPGDIAQKHWRPGSSGDEEHVGIYLGTVNGTKYYIHCAGGTTNGVYHAPGKGVRISAVPSFQYFGRCPGL